MQRRRIGVYGVCRDDHDRVLLVHGSDGDYWLLPGGGVEHGEAPASALVREFAEETGLDVTVGRLREVLFNLVAQPGELWHRDRIVYDVAVVGGQPRKESTGTTDDVRWFTLAEVADLPVTAFTADTLGAGAIDHPEPTNPAELIADSAPEISAEPVTHVQRFAAYGLTTDPADRVLLTRIATGYPGAGTWHLPGGGTDFGESAATGLVRELAEETGQVGVVGDLLAIEHFHNPAAYGPEKRPIDWHTVRSVFRVIVTKPTDPIVHDRGGSTDAAAWFTRSELGLLNLNRLARTVISDSWR